MKEYKGTIRVVDNSIYIINSVSNRLVKVPNCCKCLYDVNGDNTVVSGEVYRDTFKSWDNHYFELIENRKLVFRK